MLDRAREAVAQVDLRLPAEQVARARDVGLAHLRVVDRQRLEHDLRARLGQLDDQLRHLEQRHLVRVADVHRLVHVRLGEQHEAADQVVDVTEAARLGAVAEDRDRLVGERLAHEGRDRAAVVRPHARAEGVEDADDAVSTPCWRR